MAAYSGLLKLEVLYFVSIVIAAIVLAWNQQLAWTIFAVSTSLLLLAVFRNVAAPFSNKVSKIGVAEEVATRDELRELGELIGRGFRDADRQARLKVFEFLERTFARRIKRELAIGDAEFEGLLRNYRRLNATVNDDDLVMLLSQKLRLNVRSWDLNSLELLVTKIEGWRH